MDEIGFPVYKGLQKPLEFMGIRGRFLTIAGITIGLGLIAFFIISAVIGKPVAFGVSIVIIGSGLITIYIKQKSGLHSKKKDKGIKIYCNLFKIK